MTMNQIKTTSIIFIIIISPPDVDVGKILPHAITCFSKWFLACFEPTKIILLIGACCRAGQRHLQQSDGEARGRDSDLPGWVPGAQVLRGPGGDTTHRGTGQDCHRQHHADRVEQLADGKLFRTTRTTCNNATSISPDLPRFIILHLPVIPIFQIAFVPVFPSLTIPSISCSLLRAFPIL